MCPTQRPHSCTRSKHNQQASWCELNSAGNIPPHFSASIPPRRAACALLYLASLTSWLALHACQGTHAELSHAMCTSQRPAVQANA